LSQWEQMDSPRSLLMKGCVLKGSKSSVCSPVPMKMIGLLVAATLKKSNKNKSNRCITS